MQVKHRHGRRQLPAELAVAAGLIGRLLPGGRDRVNVPLSELSRGLSLTDFGRAT